MDRRNPITSSSRRRRSAPSARGADAAQPSRAAPSDGRHDQARRGFGAWLSAGRDARGLTREQVARTTRIQVRIIERLEEARFDELPADVFVRGFIRNYARCVGLSVDDALARYSACGFAAAPVASAQARALLDSMAALAPDAARAAALSSVSAPRVLRDPAPAPVVAPAVAGAPHVAADGAIRATAADTSGDAGTGDAASAEAAPSTQTGRRRRKRSAGKGAARQRDARGRFVRRAEAADSPDGAAEQAAEAAAAAAGLDAAARAADAATAAIGDALAPGSDDLASQLADDHGDDHGDDDLDVEITFVDDDHELADVDPVHHGAASADTSTIAAIAAASPGVTTVRVPQVASKAPSLVIDDDDPDQAEREQEERARDRDGGWRSFLPPALLDQDRGRQGGLTLAVIILLIVATLTLSYLMRRPSSTGEGVTSIPSAPAQLA